jgi:hypothetical protein
MKQLNEQFRRMQYLAGIITESQLNELRSMNGIQSWVFNFQITHLIENLKKNDILRDYIERGKQSRFLIPMDDERGEGKHPYMTLIDEISKDLGKSNDVVKKAFEEIGTLAKRDKSYNSPITYSDKSGLGNFYELISELFYKLELNVDEDTAKKIYDKYKSNTKVQGPTSELFKI